MAAWATEWGDGAAQGTVTELPVLMVVAREDAMTAWLAALCETLRIRMHLVADAASLPDSLARTRPVALLCGDLGEQGRPMARLLRLVAQYDPTLPVLIMTSDEPETLGTLDAATDLWHVENLQRVALPVPVSTVLDFLANAGRRRGTSTMMRI